MPYPLPPGFELDDEEEQSFAAPRAASPPPGFDLDPEPEQFESITQKLPGGSLLEGLGTVMSFPKHLTDTASQKIFGATPWEILAPAMRGETLPFGIGEMVKGEREKAEAQHPYLAAINKGVSERGGAMLTDPMMAATGGPALFRVGMQALLGVGAVDQARMLYDEVSRNGFSPKAAELLAGAGVDVANIAGLHLAGKGGRKIAEEASPGDPSSTKPAPPSIESKFAGMKPPPTFGLDDLSNLAAPAAPEAQVPQTAPPSTPPEMVRRLANYPPPEQPLPAPEQVPGDQLIAEMGHVPGPDAAPVSDLASRQQELLGDQANPFATTFTPPEEGGIDWNRRPQKSHRPRGGGERPPQEALSHVVAAQHPVFGDILGQPSPADVAFMGDAQSLPTQKWVDSIINQVMDVTNEAIRDAFPQFKGAGSGVSIVDSQFQGKGNALGITEAIPEGTINEKSVGLSRIDPREIARNIAINYSDQPFGIQVEAFKRQMVSTISHEMTHRLVETEHKHGTPLPDELPERRRLEGAMTEPPKPDSKVAFARRYMADQDFGRIYAEVQKRVAADPGIQELINSPEITQIWDKLYKDNVRIGWREPGFPAGDFEQSAVRMSEAPPTEKLPPVEEKLGKTLDENAETSPYEWQDLMGEGFPEPQFSRTPPPSQPGGKTSPPFPKAKKAPLKPARIGEYINIPRAVSTAIDISGPLRQAVIYSYRHPIKATKLAAKATRAFFDGEYAALEEGKMVFGEQMYKKLKQHPDFEHVWADERSRKQLIKDFATPEFRQAKKDGLEFTTHATPEEFFYGSRIIHEWAKRAGVEKLNPVNMSERSFNYFLNAVRQDLHASNVKMLHDLGMGDSQKAREVFARWANDVTGRGQLKGENYVSRLLKGSNNLLNAIFFSPRLIYARMAVLNPMRYVRDFQTLQKAGGTSNAAKAMLMGPVFDMAAFISVGSTIAGMTAAALGGKVEEDPRSSDFGKVRIGNTRFNPFADLQTYVRAAAQFIEKETKTKYGKIQPQLRGQTIGRFAQSKLSPVAGAVVTLLNERDYKGERVESAEERAKFLGETFAPMAPRDIAQVWKEDPALGLALTLPIIYGASTAVHEGPPTPSAEEFYRLQVSPPVKNIERLRLPETPEGAIPSHKLSPEEIESVNERVDPKIYEALERVLQSPRFKALSPKVQQLILKDLVRDANEAKRGAAYKLIPPPRLRESWKTGRRELPQPQESEYDQ